MYHRFLISQTEPDLSQMRLFISGSAPLSAEDFRGFEARFGYDLGFDADRVAHGISVSVNAAW